MRAAVPSISTQRMINWLNICREREREADDDKQCSAQVFKKAGRHFKRPGQGQKGAGRRALQKRPR